MPDGRVGWGLIGASTISKEWMIDAIRAQPDAAVAALFSRDPERGRRFADEHNIPTLHTSLAGLLTDPAVDVVYVASTNERHHPEVLKIAAAGRHVLCEKPLALSIEQGMEMVRACAAAGVVLAVNHHLRNSATHRAIRHCVQSGLIGRPVTARIAHGALLPPHLQSWRIKDAAAGAGAILDLTVHDADLLRFLLDDEIRAVATMAADSGLASPGIEDTALTLLRTARGTLAEFQDVFNTPFNRTAVELHGTEGSVVARDVMTQRPVGTVRLRNRDGERTLELEHENLYVRGVRRFMAAIRGEDSVPCSGLDGVRSLAVALAALDSARTGREVQVPEVVA